MHLPFSQQEPDDARRYQRLRVLGCAPFGTKQLNTGTVLRFTNLDEHVDADLAAYPSRGESASPPPAGGQEQHDDQCETELTSHGYTPCRCAEREPPAGAAGLRELRAMFAAGIKTATDYGDNVHHCEGEQRERCFQKALGDRGNHAMREDDASTNVHRPWSACDVRQ